MNAAIKVGDLIEVLGRYVMADNPPFIGRGRREADEWTGRVYRVVGFSRSGLEVIVCSPALIDPTIDDEENEFRITRVKLFTGQPHRIGSGAWVATASP